MGGARFGGTGCNVPRGTLKHGGVPRGTLMNATVPCGYRPDAGSDGTESRERPGWDVGSTGPGMIGRPMPRQVMGIFWRTHSSVSGDAQQLVEALGQGVRVGHRL